MDVRHNWTTEEILALLDSPLETLCEKAQEVHARYGAKDVQKCMLLSVKTGGCPEDCGYCSQSAHFKTDVSSEPLMDVGQVVGEARRAREKMGATRFCLGAAWRDLPSDGRFSKLLQMIRGVAETGMEVCCTMGMATEDQLLQMKEAGLTAYNHNIDTGPEYYEQVVTTRKFHDRLETLKAVRKTGVQICSGGILGMGEGRKDRASMLRELSQFNPHPESVPINLLVPIKGTPMADEKAIEFEEFLRVVATTRIVMPRARVRLSAGRNSLSQEQQLECFKLGANSIFIGEKLLTAPNVKPAMDEKLYQQLGQNF